MFFTGLPGIVVPFVVVFVVLITGLVGYFLDRIA
jgi:hypothetical protein